MKELNVDVAVSNLFLFGGFGVGATVLLQAFLSEDYDGFLRFISQVDLKMCYKYFLLHLSNLLFTILQGNAV